MSDKKKVTLKILFLLIATDVLETGAQFFFKKTAAVQAEFIAHTPIDLLIFGKNALLTPWVWAAFACVILMFTLWSTVLSKIDLSVAVPVASFSYIFVPLASLIFLHEKIPLLRWGGILLIILGVIFVSNSSQEKKEA